MFSLRFALIAMIVAAQYAPDCQAQTVREGGRHLTFDKHGNPAPFESKPARELMSKNEFKNYSRALKNFNCARANRILNKAFIRQYPIFRDARLGPQCPVAPYCHHWAHYARVNFDEYGYCTTITRLRKAEDEIRQRKIPQTKFKMKAGWNEDTAYDNRWIESRDHILSVLISKARGDYKPALVKLAELVRRGDLFNAGEDVEYYILKRACIVGNGCRVLAHRFEELRARIGTHRIAEIDKMAQAKDQERRLHKLLLGERL